MRSSELLMYFFIYAAFLLSRVNAQTPEQQDLERVTRVKQLTDDAADSPMVEKRTQSVFGFGIAFRF